MIYKFRSIDHPEANGRIPGYEEPTWTFTLPLEEGRTLKLEMGLAMFEDFCQLVERARQLELSRSLNHED